MKLLLSVTSVEETKQILNCGIDFIDVKDPSKGSLGANTPSTIADIMKMKSLNSSVVYGAALGDLPSAVSFSKEVVCCGVEYIKVGLAGVHDKNEAINMITGIVNHAQTVDVNIKVVVASYADYTEVNSVATTDLIEIATSSKAHIVMIDTAIKNGNSIFDLITIAELELFVKQAHQKDLIVSLAGSLNANNIIKFKNFCDKPDIIGVRGGVCINRNRNDVIDITKVNDVVKLVHSI